MSGISRTTHIFDATGQALGRFASKIALLLMGKGKRSYAPNLDQGDYVVVQNVKNIRLTGQKLEQKEFKHFSGYPGGLKRIKLGTLLAQNPKKLLWLAVYRMLPKNRLRAQMIKRMKIE